MFSWASGTLEKISANAAGHLERLSQTVAPAPTDPPSRFVYCCQKGDEQGAIAAASELADVGVIVNPAKGQTALHVACGQALPLTVRHILLQPGAVVQLVDAAGNTPLHCAAMSSNASTTIQVVKLLITEFQASVTAKNTAGETPYDVAPLNVVRQYLLPLQLQEETRIALDNGGVGLPPGIDLGGLKINNSHLPPPPTAMGGAPPGPTLGAGPPPMGAPPQQQQQVGGMGAPPQQLATTVSTPVASSPAPPAALGMPAPPSMSSISAERRSTSQPVTPSSSSITGAIPPAPTSTGSDYARRGYSSAAIDLRNAQGRRVLKPDGFHSSSSDKNLQAKYGHQPVGSGRVVPPPPSSGNSSNNNYGNGPQSAPPSMGGAAGPNPFALSGGGVSGTAAVTRLPRYVAVDPVTGQQSRYAQPPPMSTPQYQQPQPQAVPNFTTFSPGMASQQQQQHQYQPSQQQAYQQPAPQQYPSVSTTATSSPTPYAAAPGAPYPPQAASASPLPPAASMFQTPSPTNRQQIPKPPQSGGSASAAEVFSSSAPAVSEGGSASAISTLQQQQQPAQTQPAATPFSSPPPAVNTASLTPGPPSSGNSPFGQSGANAKDLFSRPSSNATETNTTGSTETPSADATLGSEQPTCATTAAASTAAAPADAPITAKATSLDTAEEDDMQEVPLSPSPQQYKVQAPQQPAGAAGAPTGDAPNSLYAAIGMPPPPMSKQ